MIISRTPFRISFFGGGTDYPAWYRRHGGAVLAASIDKYCYLTCRYLPPFFEHRIRIVYRQIEACAPFATHTHIRDRFGDNHHPIDLDRVWQIFAKAGYRGYMSAEYEGEEDSMTGVPKLIDTIKTLCKKYSTA